MAFVDKIIGIVVFCIMLVSLLADPAPVSIELSDVILILLPFFLGFLSLVTLKSYKIYLPEKNLLIAIMIYLGYLLLSMLLGLMHGVPFLNSLRSLGPYINFFPLILLGLLPIRLVNPWMIGTTLMLVGAMQASYQLYLYVHHSYGSAGTLDVLRHRITLLEPRTTLPIILSVTTLPMVWLSNKNSLAKYLALSFILFGLVAAAATLTRSIIISIVVGWVTYSILFLTTQSYKQLFRKFFIYFIVLMAVILLMSLIPKINMLEQGVWARFSYHSSAAGSTDYSNGRLYDEWLPAINTWANSGVLGLFFGIGAGNTFIVASGEERTYIHNLAIYSLVYGGFYGLFACLWLYFTVFKTLLIRAAQSNQLIYLGFAALLASMFSYAQLFAVHKGLAFNAMLFLIITLALSQPRRT